VKASRHAALLAPVPASFRAGVHEPTGANQLSAYLGQISQRMGVAHQLLSARRSAIAMRTLDEGLKTAAPEWVIGACMMFDETGG
jgi:hypothetical protein